MNDLLAKLSAPFASATVSWRPGPTNQDKTRALALAYIDARDVQDRLDDVCGPFWQVRHHYCGGEKLACDIGIKVGDREGFLIAHIDGEWIWRGDGAGASDVEAEKGAFSDAFKRAAVRWGIGRYLYDVDAPWVAIEKKGNTYIILDNELARLRGLLERGARPTPAATRDATSAEPSRGPSSTGEAVKTLSQIRDRVMEALRLADARITPQNVLDSNAVDLTHILKASAKTHAGILAYAEQRKAELAAPNGALQDKVAERLGA
jgi:hypothetical protein